jgi:hypothetical protein
VVPLHLTSTECAWTPPKILLKDEATLFDETVAATLILKVGDVAMIATYAQATVKTMRLSREQDTQALGEIGPDHDGLRDQAKDHGAIQEAKRKKR